ncbi:MAG: hypothetical protein QOF41_2061 [Methylobacteriaceae bacterium]|nr:hypothetical protein [Methylobacteriaceae bacterium]
MPIFPDRELDGVYAAIGEILTDEELELLVREATGKDIYNEFCSISDTRKVKIKKTIEALKSEGNERWLLTYVLIYAAAQERLRRKFREKVVNAFPKTLKDLPEAETHVGKVLANLAKVLNIPLTLRLKAALRSKQRKFEDVVQSIVMLFAYKRLHELLLMLLFTISHNETLLAGPSEDVTLKLESITRQIGQVIQQAPVSLALLGDAGKEQVGIVEELAKLSVSVAAARGPDNIASAIDDIQRFVRQRVGDLNKKIFATVQKLSFEPFMIDFPSEIEERDEFKDLVQAMRDLTATILARTLKHRIWQDAENQMSLVGNYFVAADDAPAIAEDWFALRDCIDWLAALEPDEPWLNEAKVYATELETELFKEQQLDEGARIHFDTYRTWFMGPFKKVDETLTMDYGSLCKIDDQIKKITDELR